ncbi:TIGR03086 family metal-binding protein [Mycolicibacterium sp. HK-90]|uniref:TIGR03086 family metal-binding protein n=1 Tax=Mycolicibacterium sp. HK-90 TaxID=3056937 RepID=UPI00265810BC|nr:TIGR03086 family metal-binding protein [Mycolicibacterium sp. HK-90]WKG03238.1 TIGR03086 family metal-binding protein [Mycolicibacterium sp. HK-90]
MDELDSAEATLDVLQRVLHGITADDLTRQTPCREFDVAGLTDHLLTSITLIGSAAGAQLPDRDQQASVEDQVTGAARPAVAAWQRRGLDGTVPFGPGEAPAQMMARILSLEFLVHAWDYAAATGQSVDVADEHPERVLGWAREIITPEGRVRAGFDDPVDVAGGASPLDRLLAFTGRRPTG